MFELENFTKAKLTEVAVLSQKNREPDANPGCALSFSMELSNHFLAHFDGSLKHFLYAKSAATTTPKQKGLEGVDEISDTPNLTVAGSRIGKFHWDHDLMGYELAIDHGLGGASNLTIGDVQLSSFRIDPKEGGTIVLTFLAESNDVPEGVFGKLATLKNREVSIQLAPAEAAQSDLDK